MVEMEKFENVHIVSNVILRSLFEEWDMGRDYNESLFKQNVSFVFVGCHKAIKSLRYKNLQMHMTLKLSPDKLIINDNSSKINHFPSQWLLRA